jgi:hypothetical protein
MLPAGYLGSVVALVAIVSATVAVSLGKISGEAYVGIVGVFGGAGAGAAAHSAGTAQGQGQQSGGGSA